MQIRQCPAAHHIHAVRRRNYAQACRQLDAVACGSGSVKVLCCLQAGRLANLATNVILPGRRRKKRPAAWTCCTVQAAVCIVLGLNNLLALITGGASYPPVCGSHRIILRTVRNAPFVGGKTYHLTLREA